MPSTCTSKISGCTLKERQKAYFDLTGESAPISLMQPIKLKADRELHKSRAHSGFKDTSSGSHLHLHHHAGHRKKHSEKCETNNPGTIREDHSYTPALMRAGVFSDQVTKQTSQYRPSTSRHAAPHLVSQEGPRFQSSFYSRPVAQTARNGNKHISRSGEEGMAQVFRSRSKTKISGTRHVDTGSVHSYEQLTPSKKSHICKWVESAAPSAHGTQSVLAHSDSWIDHKPIEEAEGLILPSSDTSTLCPGQSISQVGALGRSRSTKLRAPIEQTIQSSRDKLHDNNRRHQIDKTKAPFPSQETTLIEDRVDGSKRISRQGNIVHESDIRVIRLEKNANGEYQWRKEKSPSTKSTYIAGKTVVPKLCAWLTG